MNIIIIYNILNVSCKGYKINHYQNYFFLKIYFRICIITSLGRMNMSVLLVYMINLPREIIIKMRGEKSKK